jgi:hypothetical protein
VKKKKVIKRNRRHGKRGKGTATHPLAVEIAEAFWTMRTYYHLLENCAVETKPERVEFVRSLIRDEQNDCLVALSKLAAGAGNPFPEIGRALKKMAKLPPPKTTEIIWTYGRLSQDNHGQPPSCKELCHALYGSNWTESQESLVRQVAHKNDLALQRLH